LWLEAGRLLALTVDAIQLREEHWVIADLHGKAGHIRTVPIPFWVKEVIDRWTQASGIKEGCLFRAINTSGQIWGHGMTPKVLWEIVKKAAEAAGIDKLAPHDLRRYAEFRIMASGSSYTATSGRFRVDHAA
jgi:integrase